MIQRLIRLIPEASKFLTVGGFAYIIDTGLFNILRYVGDNPLLADKPLTAKIISATAATFFAYFGNKQWTYASRTGRKMSQELVLFFILNAVAMGIAVLCLFISHYILDFTTPLADNIAANVVGVGLGTLFRFVTYRKWVFVR
ncbi:MAG: GtrA family protein [Candidatus Nanopelagicales bacterium]